MTDLQAALIAPVLALLLALVAQRRGMLVAGLPRGSALLFLLPFALACACVFPSRDDWCYGASGHTGWWAAQEFWYAGWSGRATTTAVITGWGLLGSPWFAAMVGYRLIIAGIFACTCWALHDLIGAALPRIDRPTRRLLTVAAAAGWISILSDPTEGLYWLSGVASYGIGTLLALIACSSLLRGADGARWRWRVALATLPLACLSSEVVAAVSLTAIALVMAGRLRGMDRWRAAAVLAAGLLATAVALLAPGNAVRAQVALAEGTPLVDHAPWAIATGTLRLAWGFVADTAWAPLAACAAWVAWNAPRPERRTAAVLPLLLIPLLILSAALPMAWAGMSPNRAWNPLAAACSLLLVIGAWRGGPRIAIPLLIGAGVNLILHFPPGLDGWIVPAGAWLAVGGAIWLLRKQLAASAIIAALACALLLGSERFTSAAKYLTRAPQYVLQQQERLDELAAAPADTDVVVHRLQGDLPYLLHVDDLGMASSGWANQGCAAFFGLRSVRAK